jgi:hypothetical protein
MAFGRRLVDLYDTPALQYRTWVGLATRPGKSGQTRTTLEFRSFWHLHILGAVYRYDRDAAHEAPFMMPIDTRLLIRDF